VLPPNEAPASVGSSATESASAVADTMPKPDPGGQSGSDSNGSTFCPTEEIPLDPDEPTVLGPSGDQLLAEHLAWLEAHDPYALYWQGAGWKPTAVTVTLIADGEPVLVKAIEGGACAGGAPVTLLRDGARLRLHTEDGLVDQEFEGAIQLSVDEAGSRLGFSGGAAGSELLRGALADALPEAPAIEDLDPLDEHDSIEVGVTLDGSSLAGFLQLWLRDDEDGTNTRSVELASITSLEPAPPPRRPIEPSPGLVAACAGAASVTLPLEPPNVAWVDRLAVLAGTWALCGGDRAETLDIDHAAITLDVDGAFVHAVEADGALTERTGFGHEGAVRIWDADMCVGSNCITTRGLYIDDLLFPTAQGYAGAGSSRIELSADGDTMRWFVESDQDRFTELLYVKTDTPVQSAPAPLYAANERAGEAGCEPVEHGLRNTSTREELASLLVGTWTWCSGAPYTGDELLELGADGRYRARGEAGTVLHAGSYSLQTGNPPSVYYVELLGDDGRAWSLFESRISDAPLKLLVVSSHETSHIGVLSASPE
jgi:hypothetical protein